MQVTEVKSSLWAMSLQGIGNIVQGVDYINQSIEIVLTTRKGEDLLRPDFGCSIFDLLDKPINMVRASMLNEVTKAIKQYITEIKVTSVTTQIDGGHLTVNVQWVFINTTETNQTNVNYGIK